MWERNRIPARFFPLYTFLFLLPTDFFWCREKMASPPVQESDLSGFVRALTPRLTAKIKEGQGLETAEDRFKMPLFPPKPQCPKCVYPFAESASCLNNRRLNLWANA